MHWERRADDKCQLWWLVWCGGSIWPSHGQGWLVNDGSPHLNTACPSNLNSHSSILDQNLDVFWHDQTENYDHLTVNNLYDIRIGSIFERRQLELNLHCQPGGNYYYCAWHYLIWKSFNWPTIISTTSLQKRAKNGTASLPHNLVKLSRTMNDSLIEQMAEVAARTCY